MSILQVCSQGSGWDCAKALLGVYNPPKVASPAAALGGCNSSDDKLDPKTAAITEYYKDNGFNDTNHDGVIANRGNTAKYFLGDEKYQSAADSNKDGDLSLKEVFYFVRSKYTPNLATVNAKLDQLEKEYKQKIGRCEGKAMDKYGTRLGNLEAKVVALVAKHKATLVETDGLNGKYDNPIVQKAWQQYIELGNEQTRQCMHLYQEKQVKDLKAEFPGHTKLQRLAEALLDKPTNDELEVVFDIIYLVKSTQGSGPANDWTNMIANKVLAATQNKEFRALAYYVKAAARFFNEDNEGALLGCQEALEALGDVATSNQTRLKILLLLSTALTPLSYKASKLGGNQTTIINIDGQAIGSPLNIKYVENAGRAIYQGKAKKQAVSSLDVARAILDEIIEQTQTNSCTIHINSLGILARLEKASAIYDKKEVLRLYIEIIGEIAQHYSSDHIKSTHKKLEAEIKNGLSAEICSDLDSIFQAAYHFKSFPIKDSLQIMHSSTQPQVSSARQSSNILKVMERFVSGGMLSPCDYAVE